MALKHLHNVYVVKIGRDGQPRRHPAGRFLTAGRHLHILEDYHDLLSRHLQEGPLDLNHFQALHRLKNSQYLDVVSQHDLEQGHRPDLLPEVEMKDTTRAPSAFEYHHKGNVSPDTVEFRDGVPHFNGAPTTHPHVHALLQNARSGLATLRYRQERPREQAIKKMESAFLELQKADPSKLTDTFAKLRELVAAGHLDPEHERILATHIYKDAMIPEIGNKFAYTDFLSRPRDGIHVIMDGNDFKSVNDKYGHHVGDEAIKSMGRALRAAMDESTGDEHGKLFRMGGDEFAAHFPSHEHAAKFARLAQKKLGEIEPIAGSHRLSMGFGIGHTPEHADQALYEAKKQKYHPETMSHPDSRMWQSKFPKGAAPSMAHSLVPGMEGAVPLDETQFHISPPPPPPVKEGKPAATASVPAAPAAPVSAPALATKPA